jgi:two-component system response regulator AlgR
MKILIVDDEPLARARLQRLLTAFPEHQVVGEAADGGAALSETARLQPDLVLLDIAMPQQNGLQLAAQLMQFQPPPAVVFVTAHPQHALEAYQVAAADYLLKPVSAATLGAMLQRIGLTTKVHLEKQQAQHYLSYRQGTAQYRIELNQLWYLQAEDKYVRLAFQGGEAWSDLSLKQYEEMFAQELVRIHRHTLVLKKRITAIHSGADGRHLLQLDCAAPWLEISRRELAKIRQLLSAG